ncbi:hypothetical protein [Alloalcanivorax xenomutans]
MSKEPPKPKIDARKLGVWLDSRGAKVECPICGHKKWSALTGANHVGNVLPYGNGEGQQYMDGFPILTLFCQNCLFIKNIALTEELLAEVRSDEPE